ncbi:hypothetical protein [Corticicoccus populi]|uniref:DUF4342 domain-containing protein n=1 Tax=Corticicoccus populi TaxID=1812821 RepID=A0ABW5WW76_9STAP
MKFINYEKKDLTEFEETLKTLVLNKGYKYHKTEKFLNKDEIVSQSLDNTSRELIKLFEDNTKITVYSLTHRKSNYYITIAEEPNKNIMSVQVIFSTKPIKQLGKLLIGLPLITFGGPFAVLVGVAAYTSSFNRFLTIKGPLGKSISNTIYKTLGEPIDNK